MNQNAFLYRQGGMWIGCGGCQQVQTCATRGHCSRDIQQAANQAYARGDVDMSSQVSLTSLFSNFRRDYNMLRDADSDGGECD